MTFKKIPASYQNEENWKSQEESDYSALDNSRLRQAKDFFHCVIHPPLFRKTRIGVYHYSRGATVLVGREDSGVKKISQLSIISFQKHIRDAARETLAERLGIKFESK